MRSLPKYISHIVKLTVERKILRPWKKNQISFTKDKRKFIHSIDLFPFRSNPPFPRLIPSVPNYLMVQQTMLKDARSSSTPGEREANERGDVRVKRRDRTWWSRRRIDRDVAGHTANLQIDSRVYTDVHTLNVRFRFRLESALLCRAAHKRQPKAYRTRSAPPQTWRAIDIDGWGGEHRIDGSPSSGNSPLSLPEKSWRRKEGKRLRARFKLAAQSSSKGNLPSHPLDSSWEYYQPTCLVTYLLRPSSYFVRTCIDG